MRGFCGNARLAEERFMDNKYFGRNIIRQIMEGRAVRICAVAVTVFLCVLTVLDFTALKLELEIPVLQEICGERSSWSENYQWEELALDNSNENEIHIKKATSNCFI